MYKISEIAEQTNEILSSHRNVANDAVIDVMMDAFQELGMLMAGTERVNGAVLEFDKGAGSFQPADLENVLIHFRKDDIAEWLMGLSENDRVSLMMKFLDYDRIRMQDFRARYPKAFMKWTPEEDSQLREMYESKCSWRQLSEHFGRNTNALKLRLERLGYNLGSDAGRSRFHPSPLPAAASTTTAAAPQVSSTSQAAAAPQVFWSESAAGRPAAVSNAPASPDDGRSKFSGHVRPLVPSDDAGAASEAAPDPHAAPAGLVAEPAAFQPAPASEGERYASFPVIPHLNGEG